MSDYSDLMNFLRIDDRGAKGPAVQSQEKGKARPPGKGERVLAERSEARRVNPPSVVDANGRRITSGRKIVYTPANDVEEKKVAWLWRRRFILEKVNIIGGHPGVGKSFITIDMAARMSVGGGEWPDGVDTVPRGRTIFVSAEDDKESTIVPRLKAAGADLNYIGFIDGVKTPQGPDIVQLDVDYQLLEDTIREKDARLVVLDPLLSFVSREVNPNLETDVRRLLYRLGEVAHRTGAAIVAIMHFNKKQDLDDIQRITGAMGFVGAPRSSCIVKKAKEKGVFTLSTLKLNVGKEAMALSFRIEDAHPGDPEDETGKLIWLDADPAGQRGKAIALLKEKLPVYAPGVPGFPVAQLNAEAEARGISKSTLERARADLGVTCERIGDGWYVWVPAPGEQVNVPPGMTGGEG